MQRGKNDEKVKVLRTQKQLYQINDFIIIKLQHSLINK